MTTSLSSKFEFESRRIRWRQELLNFPEGVRWLAAQVHKGARDRDLGPHRTDAPTR